MSEINRMLAYDSPFILADYENEHHSHNQSRVDNIAINPSLRPDFDNTAHDKRDSNELQDWWDKPYIVTKSWSDIEAAFVIDRALLSTRCTGDCTVQQDRMDKARQSAREDWFDKYPYGIRYEIRCLDGRIPNRATVWGTEGTLAAAIRCAKAGPAWRNEHEQSTTRNIVDWDASANSVTENETSNLEEQLVHWTIKTTDKKVTEADREACERWLAKNRVHRMLYNDLMAMWDSPAFEWVLKKSCAQQARTLTSETAP